MKSSRALAILALGLAASSFSCKAQKATSVEPTHVETNHTHPGGDDHAAGDEAAPSKLVLTNLIKERLAENEDLEVIVSTVEVPPNTELPKHYHPGQEFAYVIEGSMTVAVDGAEERTVKAGEAGIVPARAHHRAWTNDEAAKLVVFRVHDPEKPVRYLIGADGKEIPAAK